MDYHWRPDSLHSFWSKCWYEVLRETFFIFGGFPGRIITGNIDILFGTFLGSGLYHEFTHMHWADDLILSFRYFLRCKICCCFVKRVDTNTLGTALVGCTGGYGCTFAWWSLGSPCVRVWACSWWMLTFTNLLCPKASVIRIYAERDQDEPWGRMGQSSARLRLGTILRPKECVE
jgi:hypothetical protein